MITKLILKGYLPLKDKGINEIVLDKLGDFNIILGRNGYGKTSIMRQLNYYPPDNSAFDEETGYKEIHAVMNGKHYRLTTKTSSKRAVNHFYIDGENHNKSTTSATQKELVRQHFGLTNDVRHVVSGIRKGDAFSSLSPMRRKQVLMDINPNDVSYALKIYDDVRQEHNYVKNALKYQRQRLAAELQRQKEVAAAPIDELTYEIKLLDERIKEALLLQGMLKDVKHVAIEPNIRKLEKLMADMFSSVPPPDFAPSYYVELSERTKLMMNDKHHRIIELDALIMSLKDRIAKVGQRHPITEEEYEEKKERYILAISQDSEVVKRHRATIASHSFFSDKRWDNKNFVAGIKTFVQQLHKVKLSTCEELTASGFTQLQESLDKAERNVNFLEKERDNFRHQLSHFDQAKSIDCPKCHHLFKRGFEKFDKDGVLTQIDKITEALKNAKKLATELRQKVTENEPWYYSMKSLIEFIRYSSERHYLLEIIKYYDIGKKPAAELITILDVIFCHHENVEKVNTNKAALEELDIQFARMKEFDIHALYWEIDSHQKERNGLERGIRRHKEELALWRTYLDRVKTDELTYSIFTACFEETLELLADHGFHAIKQEVNQRLSDDTPKRDALLAQLMKSNSLSKVVESITKEVKELEEKERHLSYLVETLSPTKGLIGYLMLDFLNAICANVNAIIKEVWTDPLVLLAPNINEEDVDLDYKFRVVTTNPEKPISDISECSGGEIDLIDFLIRLTLLRYLKTSPLFMDEVGVTFDELHRQKFSHYISTQARLNNLPQVFMISHYVSQYGIFNNNDVNVIKLNTTGMKVPVNANENVTIR